jgi:POT family proton-dependent oligopeptide transporter|tara:strand:+ start:1648 stop:2469 length:822 start_codon:yes stop_codon:yes gene_type:complete|mmetsp:Transcript_2954/g.10352  ORF Transcript_2954/g.10352 Transcript_2954/m.10352 type:complete len:274 (+) Transcript_2954:107-928(+)
MRWPDTLTRPIGLLKRAPYELRLVYLLKALDSYGYFALSEVFTTYFGEFGVSDITAGTLYGTWGMLITAWGVVTGFAIDAMGVRQSLIACYVLQIFARLVLAFTTNKTSAIVTLFTVQALATSWGAPVMTIAIKRLSVTNEDRVVSFGLFYSTMNVAALLSGLAIDLLRLGAPSDTYGYLGVTTPIRGVVLSTVVSSAFALVVATKFHRVTAHTVRRSQAESFDGKDTTVIAASKKVSSFLQTVKVLSASKSFWQFLTLGLFTVNLKQVRSPV